MAVNGPILIKHRLSQ